MDEEADAEEEEVKTGDAGAGWRGGGGGEHWGVLAGEWAGGGAIATCGHRCLALALLKV